MLDNNGFHCYADDSTCDALHKGPAQLSPSQLVACRSKLMSEIEGLLDIASEWGAQNFVQFNPTKPQVCAFTAKKTAFTAAPQFRNTLLTISNSIGILGVNISNEVQFRAHLEGKAKLASKMLGVLNRAKRYFTSNML
ncbi:jg27427 [Pararge aegeria aegeria]|uniref:Jg27427 protein n=1 Tax=Pararge aegeria aegeria TaxID=348720 RepID=A0A8S4QGL3_9NEOP|nr:jg27427 [Pararge aegeria aegeria]